VNAFLQSVSNMQIVTGIEVNGEANFPKLLEYCPSAEGTRAIFQQLREDSLLIDDDSHYLFCYTSDRNGDGINLSICVTLH